MPKALLISHNEICYNARLLKAADSLDANGWDVAVYNPITGIASKEVYQETIKKRNWKVIENDLSKRTPLSKMKWALVSVLHQLIVNAVNRFNINVLEPYFMNKGLLLGSRKHFKEADVYIVHLVDNLPFAALLKKKYGGVLVYDSQEYFTGQYTKLEADKHKWVVRNEKKYISAVDLLLTTTNVMKQRLIEDYGLSIPVVRLRNLPSKNQIVSLASIPIKKQDKEPIKLVWHGMAIYFNNRRGVHVLIEAISKCQSNVELYLQGNFPVSEQKILEDYKVQFDLKDRIKIKPAANPDEIVASLVHYDIGLTGELPEEENQQLTSSNKLFDYINAGLAVITSDTLGLVETVEEYGVGKIYKSGEVEQLAQFIDELASNPDQLERYKLASRKAAKELQWENDYQNVLDQLKRELSKEK